MRLLQNSALAASYRVRLDQLAPKSSGFEQRRGVFLDDRFGALHILQPVLAGDADAFFTNGNDEVLQRLWAQENGMRAKISHEDILLAQIEHHRTEVFYNLDPVRYPSRFVRRLPGCVRKALCWRAAPSGQADLTAYGAVLGNFPSILDAWRRKGCQADLFYPAIDPLMNQFGHGERPIDVLFVGGYSRHHAARARILEQVASLASSRQVVYRLDASRLTLLAESPLGRLLPLRKHRRPPAIAAIAGGPVFGRELYDLIGKSKVVLNGAIDMADRDRGNMRCFEAMGCGALLVSDDGNYPTGMERDVTMRTFASAERASDVISNSLDHWQKTAEVAMRGRSRISEIYNKSSQWISFVDLVAGARPC